jgi:hypothetical protein
MKTIIVLLLFLGLSAYGMDASPRGEGHTSPEPPLNEDDEER